MKYAWNKNIVNSLDKSGQLAPISKPTTLFGAQKINVTPKKPTKAEIIYRNSAYLCDNAFCEDEINSALKIMPKKINCPHIYARVNISEALEYTRSFYSSMTSPIVEAFDWAFERKEGRIQTKMYNPLASFSGQSFLYDEDYLMSFVNTNNISSLYNLVHEFAHIIVYYLRQFTKPDHTNQVFREVESRFFEMALFDYFKDNTTVYFDLLNKARQYYNALYYHFKCEQCWYPLAQYLNKFPNMSTLDVYYNAYDSLGYSPQTLKRLLLNPAEQYLPYVYADLIAAELFNIYRQNPQEGLDLYLKTLTLEGKSPSEKHDYLKTFITPSEHYDDYVDLLKR